MEGVKLIAAPLSLYCCRVEMALKYKGIEYEYIYEDVYNKSALLLKYNPIHKKVPVLLHNGIPVNESLVILEYIDETWKERPLMPKDPNERASARFGAEFADEKCIFGVWGACVAEGIEKEKAIASALASLSHIEKLIEGKKYFAGEEIGYLDIALGWIPLWISVFEEVGDMKILEAKKFPWLHQWAQSFIQIPSISESMPPRDEFLNYVRGCANHLRSLAAKKL